ncbi:hypothetical protein X777_11675 [Ooceraea biroi]|uniref:Uncharacterized protein n=1 Tax=Ooceraea biroi TaxID=2015173 RepID=A0A026W161_OOCBI|nr:hypothetical protein X777_11675 [Ooceraea biroi]
MHNTLITEHVIAFSISLSLSHVLPSLPSPFQCRGFKHDRYRPIHILRPLLLSSGRANYLPRFYKHCKDTGINHDCKSHIANHVHRKSCPCC